MAIKQISNEKLLAVQAQVKEQMGIKENLEPPKPINADLVRHSTLGKGFEIRGRRYTAVPVSTPHGIRLSQITGEAAEYVKALDVSVVAAAAMHSVTREMSKIMWKYLIPESRFARAMKAIGLMRNPLMNISEGDFREIVDFFLAARTMLHSVKRI